ncbi:response regulator [Brevibacillus sp. 179-C9.3 HS]|uniref:response regulator n=1 Tax=unclassified Brevibacillus TaxID=2684853 RepID=UPI0039A025BD
MKTIIVDDEPLALRNLADELLRIGGIDIIGKFRQPSMALEMIYKERPQVVFLDIQMPEMNGIEMAERILQHLPETRIVFITAYDEYAVKAFELSALDYLLKPVQHERLCKTISRLASVHNQSDHIQPDKPGVIHCFRAIQFEQPGKEPITPRWKTLKAQELFSYLLQFRGTPVKKQTLLDQLWPDIEWKRGITQLYTAIYQIRKILGEEGISTRILNCDEGYMLELNGMKLDVEEWENKLEEAPGLSLATVEWHQRLVQQYRGDYLADHHYIWAESEKSRLRGKWLHHVHLIARCYMENNKTSEAITHYLYVQKVLPMEESVYFELMRLYDLREDRFSVEKQYELLKTMLLQEFDAEPHSFVIEWYTDWNRNG